MSEQGADARHPIRVVSERTGLTTDVLRAWEKRYGVVEPLRSETGQRLYTDADVERLLLLRQATEAGRPISQVAPLDTSELRRVVEEDEAARTVRERAFARPVTPEVEAYVAAALDAVRALGAASLNRTLEHAAVRLDAGAFLEGVVAELLRRVGVGWHEGELRAAHEHLATAVIRRVLSRLVWTGVGEGRGVVVVATPQGERHEMGALLSAATAAAEQWEVVYLGADLPAEDIARAAADVGAGVVALSLVYSAADGQVADELRRLRAAAPDVAIVVGGAGAERWAPVLREIGAERLSDLGALRAFLGSMPPRRRGRMSAIGSG